MKCRQTSIPIARYRFVLEAGKEGLDLRDVGIGKQRKPLQTR